MPPPPPPPPVLGVPFVAVLSPPPAPPDSVDGEVDPVLPLAPPPAYHWLSPVWKSFWIPIPPGEAALLQLPV